MKRLIFISIVLISVLTALAGLAACSGVGGSGGVTQQQVAVTRGDLTLSVSGDGKVGSSQQANLAFGSAGKVSTIAIKAGDKVKAGDTLASLDTHSLELALKQAQMAVTQAQSSLLQAQLAQSSAQNTLDNLKNSGDSLKLALLNAQIARDAAKISLAAGIAAVDFIAADAALNRAKTYYAYVQNQLKTATTNIDTWLMALDSAKQSLDVAQANYDNALAGYDSNEVNLKKEQLAAAELSVTLAQKNIDDLGKNVALQTMQVASANQTVTQARMALDVASDSLSDAQRQIDEATIKAPFDGVVAAVLVKEGDMIPTPSMVPTTVIQIVNPALLELVIQVDEIDVPSVKMGQPADIKVEALPDSVFKGTVSAIYPVPVEQGGIVLYSVKLDLDLPEDSGIKVGMSATADIIAARHENVLIVPSRAVTKNSQGQTVVKVKTAGKAVQEKVVTVGLDDGINAEIVSGLNQGDTVIVEVKVKSSSASLFGG
jgi:HlyD family secretion protein